MELNSHMGEADPAQKNKANIPQNESDDVMVSHALIQLFLHPSF